MILVFNKLHMKNFMSFADAEVSFNESGYTIVSGINLNKDDNAASNGAGKSTCFEAIVWALTGDTIRGTSDVKRFNADDKCEVELDFSIDGKNYKVIRSKDPSNLFFYVEDENKSGKGIRDTEKIVKEYLPDLTAQLIGSVVIMGQGLPQRFSNNSPSGRKDVLEKLSKSDFMIDDLKNKVQKRKTALNNIKREFEDQKLANTTIISNETSNLSRYEIELNTLNGIEYDSLIDEKQTIIDEQNEMLNSLKDQLDEVNNLLQEVVTKQKEISNNKADELQVISDEFTPQLKDYNKAYTEAKSNIAVLQNQINSIKNIKTHCPTCGQELKGVEKPDPQPLIDELTIANAGLTNIIDTIKILDTEQKNRVAEVNAKYNNIENEWATKGRERSIAVNNIQSQINKITGTINRITQELNEVKIKKQNHEYKVNQLNDNITNAKSKIADAKVSCETAEKELENNKLHLDIINKFEGALKRDFRGILLNNIIKYIDLRAKEYSNIVFGTDKLDFKLDGNNISITYCNKAYENLSGGEKQRVDLIVQFALRDMLCKYLNFSSNILVLDEIVDNLDSIGCQKVMELISMKLNDVNSIYIISHHSDIQMPYDHELIIVKSEEGISEI